MTSYGQPNNPGKGRSLVAMLAIFLICLTSMQWMWSRARGTEVERIVIDIATIRTSVQLINIITPGVGAVAAGSRIRAPGGGINVLNGCEGTEVLFLLASGLVAYPMSWRKRAIGVGIGTMMIFGLNQARLLSLFYSYRSDKLLFDQIHGTIAPLVLISITIGFFVFLINTENARHAAATT